MNKTETKSTVSLKHHSKALKLSTMLAECEKIVQKIMRHSTITLIMGRYSHIGLLDLNAALELLPTIVPPESQTMRATGMTDQQVADSSCTKSCNAPAKISRSQPGSRGRRF